MTTSDLHRAECYVTRSLIKDGGNGAGFGVCRGEVEAHGSETPKLIVSSVLMRSADLLSHPVGGSGHAGQRGG